MHWNARKRVKLNCASASFSKFDKFLNCCRTIAALKKERQILYHFTGVSCTNLIRLPPIHKTK